MAKDDLSVCYNLVSIGKHRNQSAVVWLEKPTAVLVSGFLSKVVLLL